MVVAGQRGCLWWGEWSVVVVGGFGGRSGGGPHRTNQQTKKNYRRSCPMKQPSGTNLCENHPVALLIRCPPLVKKSDLEIQILKLGMACSAPACQPPVRLIRFKTNRF